MAAAYLARASQRADARDLLLATDAATGAIEIDSSFAPAWFNRALALDALTLSDQARLAWAFYLKVDSSSEWAAEARTRLKPRLVSSAPLRRPAGTDRNSLLEFAQAAPAEAFTFAFDSLMGEWGRSTIAGDDARASRSLDAAAAIAEPLTQRHDYMVADMVRAAGATPPGSRERRELARAHAQYSEGRTLSLTSSGFAAADSCFADAIRLSRGSPAFRQFAEFTRANHRISVAGERATLQAIAPLRRRVSTNRYPLLAGRLEWTLGVLLTRAGEFDAGIRNLRQARNRFAALGAIEYEATMTGIEGEATLRLGLGSVGLNQVWEAARLLADRPASVNRHNALRVLEGAATDQGLSRAAIAIAEEDSTVADLTGRPISYAEVELARARAFRDAGAATLSVRSLANADRLIRSLPDGPIRLQLQMERDAEPDFSANHVDAVRARVRFDSAVAYFESNGASVKLVRTLVARAEASLRLGDEESAQSDLARAATLFAAQSASFARFPQRSGLLRQAHAAFDQLVLLRLRSGRIREARDALEQGRASFSPVGSRRDITRDGAGPSIDYGMIGDSLFAWVDDGVSVRVSRAAVGRVAFDAMIDRVTTALERGADRSAWAADLTRLYDLLIRPHVPMLGASGETIAIVAADELANVPFAALIDTTTGRYLVETRATRLAPSLHDLWASRATPRSDPRAVFVADPHLDGRLFPTLEPLPGATHEVIMASAAYAKHELLRGITADSGSTVRALRRSSIFHFAGHAVFDASQPDRSFLAIGPRGLSATAIAMLDLSHLELAVLSACETARSGSLPGSSGGLSEAFLAAGTRGVVASRWRTNDAWTLPLMTGFHKVYAERRDGALALRDAQLALLHSGDPALAAPAVWSAFQYQGR